MALLCITLRKTAPCIAAMALLTWTTHALANSKVYQVEMIVFERTAGADAEGWQENVLLDYPENWQRLIDPDEEAAERTQADQEESLRLSDDFLQTLAEERGEYQENTSAPITEEQSSSAPGPAYFEYLPDDARGLQKTRDALVRRNQYRILFHETWLQPFTSAEKSPALILHGGKRFGDRYELQGYINISISRFLHLQTDLWLSEFSVNHGQDVGYWPLLPVEPHLAKAVTGFSSDGVAGDQEDVSMMNFRAQQEQPSWGTGIDTWREDAQTSPYLVNQISTLRQKRRMRSGELHYLDHPRFGVLIKITPQ